MISPAAAKAALLASIEADIARLEAEMAQAEAAKAKTELAAQIWSRVGQPRWQESAQNTAAAATSDLVALKQELGWLYAGRDLLFG